MTCSACSHVRYPLSTYCGQCGGRIVAYDPLLGSTLDDRYVIESKIASGGFGSIYRARTLDGAAGGVNEVAIKVLHEQHNADPNVSARFRREAVAMASMSSEHTVTTHELGEDRDGNRFIVMELLHGESLAERFAECGALPWRTVLRIARQVCCSLIEAHALGIVHRDLKPANIFLCARDFVKVLDFGIAKISHGSNMHDGANLTRIGQAIGTLEYMSPEQLVGGALDERTDIYTLGIVMYEMISGHRPFGDVTGATGLMTSMMTRKPVPVSTIVSGSLPPDLDGVLLRCLERDAPDRYDNVRELASAIDAMLATRDDIDNTMRRWVKSEPVTIPAAPTVTPASMFAVEADAESTWVDAKVPFEVVDPHAPALAAASTPVTIPFEDAVRAQVVEAQGRALAPRAWHAKGTGVELESLESPFDLSDHPVSAHVPTGSRPLIASRHAIARASTEEAAAAYQPRRFAVGSSPAIEHEPIVSAPVTKRTSLAKLALWAIGLTGAGLGIGMGVAALLT